MNKTLPILTALFITSTFAQAAPQILDVYTYDSFSADWSAGPKVKAAFEQQFPQCKLNYVAFDNNGTLFNRDVYKRQTGYILSFTSINKEQ